MDLTLQNIGWLGTILILSAYFLVSTNRVHGTNTLYQSMNLVGALLLGIDTLIHQAWPTFTLNVAWAIIAILSLTLHRNS